MEQPSQTSIGRRARTWDTFPWRRWAGIVAGTATIAFGAAAFVVQPALQAKVTQFMLPAFSYTTLGLAAIALTELSEPRCQRVLMAAILVVLAPLSIVTYAVGGVGPLLVLGVHLGMLVGWIAWGRRTMWTVLWLVETLVWMGIAFGQGRLWS